MKTITYFLLLLLLIALFTNCSNEDPEPVAPENSAPVIEELISNPDTVAENEIAVLSCVAVDKDGDNLEYIWSSNEGSFPDGNRGISVSWQAPEKGGSFTVVITVSDGTVYDKKDIQVIVTNIVKHGDPCPGIATVTYSGKTYNTVKIGSQCWLKENMDVGTMIIVSNNENDNQNDNNLIEKYCYNNDPKNCETYGGLYQWTEAMQYSLAEGSQGICPDGWHIPTLAEFEELQTFAYNEANKILAVGQTSHATNETGFSALFAGMLFNGTGNFDGQGGNAVFLSSSKKINDNSARGMNLGYFNSNIIPFKGYEENGYSVRCIKD